MSGEDTDKTTYSDADIEQMLAMSLDQSAESVDAVTMAKLSAARHRALAQNTSSKPWYWLTPRTSGFAALGVGVLMVSLWFTNGEQIQENSADLPQQTAMLSDLEILASKDGVEFYESLDFLLWLENAPETNG